MGRKPSQKQTWNLTEECFNRLLSELDPDRGRAAKTYEDIRRRLIKFFEWRQCPIAEELADETINRVARNVCEKEKKLGPGDPYLYFLSVARNVLHEYWREREKNPEEPFGKKEHLDDAVEEEQSPNAPNPEILNQHESCQKLCLNSLPDKDQELLVRYHAGEGQQKIENREELARELGVKMNALRQRVFGLKARLKTCVACFEKCLNRSIKNIID